MSDTDNYSDIYCAVIPDAMCVSTGWRVPIKWEQKMAFNTGIIIDLPGLNRLRTKLKVLQTWKNADIPAGYILQNDVTFRNGITRSQKI
nr:hypothetical protein [uncultured Mucilaginibacter sp.]